MSGTGAGKKKYHGFTFNNTARLLKSGSDFFDALEKLIDEAKHEIHFQTYIFENDETGKRIFHALIRAAKRGVNIYLLLDAYGSGNLPEKYLQQLRKENIEVRWFGPLFRNGRFHIGRRLHRKVVVADGMVSIVAGINISDHYNDLGGNPPWFDFGVLVKGEVSKKLFLVCKQSWLKIRFRRFSTKLKETFDESFQQEDHPVKIRVRQNDWKIGRKQAALSYYQLIRKAQVSITIVGGYFLPGRKARKLLKRASERGVIIKLIVAERSDVGLMRKAVLYLYDWLLRSNIHIFEYSRSNVHGKAIVSDHKIVSIGSFDLNTLSTYSNIELNLDLDDPGFATGFQNHLEQIMEKDCCKITPAVFETKTGITGRMIRWFSYRIVKSLFILSVLLVKKDRPYQ
ncbi:MAG: phospholipase D-like domain-containing protein [Bacteroidetes bacterium]|nr:phospholipase D-like domain-containing protein [Bacteroidota bacterium]